MLQIRLLGRFDVRVGDEPVEIPSRPAQSLLAYVALTPDVAHRRERLSGLLWPEADEGNARSNLRHALWRIRQALAAAGGGSPRFLDSDNISLTYHPAPDVWVDAQAVCRPTAPHDTLDGLLADVAAYGGELLPGFYDEWVVLERERLRGCFERKMQTVLARLLAERRWADVLEWGERWIALGQAPETAFRSMMEASAGLGDRAGVAAVFKRCSEALRRDLGVEPSAQTVDLYRSLSSSEPTAAGAVDVPAEGVKTPAQAIESLFRRWHQQGVEVLDVAGLATVYAAPAELRLAREDIRLCIRSALHHGVDLRPWLERGRPVDIVGALQACYHEYPKPNGRAAIVEALAETAGPEASEALGRIVETEDSPAVRTSAALSLARREDAGVVVASLLAGLRTANEPSAMAALVAVADEIGLPVEAGPVPRLGIGLGVAQRRWRAARGQVWAQALRAAVAGALSLALHGSGTPAYMALARPEVFASASGFVTIPGWIISAAVIGLVVGGLQGAALGLAVGLADALRRRRRGDAVRLSAGALAGLIQPAYSVPFALVGLLRPAAEPAVYVPVNILYGLLLGAITALGMPLLGERPPWKRHLGLPLLCATMSALVTIPYVFLIYQAEAGISMLSRLLFAFVLTLGIGLSQCRWRRSKSAVIEAEAVDGRLARPAAP